MHDYKYIILIPGGDRGRTVAFGAIENSRRIDRILKKSCKCGNERLVSHSWCRKVMKAGSCRSTDVTTSKTAKRQSVQWHRPMQDFVYAEDFCLFIEEPTGSEIRRYHIGIFFRLAASQSPSKIWRAAAAAGKNCDASTFQSNNFGVSRKRFKPSTPGSSRNSLSKVYEQAYTCRCIACILVYWAQPQSRESLTPKSCQYRWVKKGL